MRRHACALALEARLPIRDVRLRVQFGDGLAFQLRIAELVDELWQLVREVRMKRIDDRHLPIGELIEKILLALALLFL